MPRSQEHHTAITPSGGDQLTPLEHLAQWLVGATLHIALGLLLGVAVARLMRRRHLHWSWAAGVLALVLLSRNALAGTAVTLGVAALAAAVRGRRWHGEDLQAGADLATIAARRTTLLDGLWVGLKTVRGRLSCAREASGRDERSWRGERLNVGVDRRGGAVSIELGGENGGAHTLVAGATGAGKTFTQAWIATRAIAHGMSVVAIDPKGDAGLRERLRGAALAQGSVFHVWTPEGPSIYNPFAHGGATEIADKALAGERFTEPHYQRQAQRYLGHAVRALLATRGEVTLAGLVEALDPDGLELLARELDAPAARTVHAYLDSLAPRQRSELGGVRDRLAVVAESDVGVWLDPTAHHAPFERDRQRQRERDPQRSFEQDPQRARSSHARSETVAPGAAHGAASFELLDAVRSGAVVYFGLDADARPLLAQMLGRAIVQDLLSVVAALQRRPGRCLVAIDEFSALAAEQVAGLFARARSAGVSLLLGTQELSDLRLPGRERLLEQVLGNLTNLIVHRQAVPASAELIARLGGNRGAWRTTVGSDGRTTRTRVSEPLVDPEEVMDLPRGCAAVIRLSSPRSVAITHMRSPSWAGRSRTTGRLR